MSIHQVIISNEYNSSFDSFNSIEKEILKLGKTLNFSEDILTNILVCLSEAFNNSIVHAHHNVVSKKIKILVEQIDSGLNVEVIDEGRGFDFHSLEDPTEPENIEKLNGRGLFLIKNLADHIEYSFEKRRLTMFFRKA